MGVGVASAPGSGLGPQTVQQPGMKLMITSSCMCGWILLKFSVDLCMK